MLKAKIKYPLHFFLLDNFSLLYHLAIRNPNYLRTKTFRYLIKDFRHDGGEALELSLLFFSL